MKVDRTLMFKTLILAVCSMIVANCFLNTNSKESMENIEGLVLDQNNNPVPDATISFLKASSAVQDIAILTDEEGRFFIDDLKPGRYMIRVFYGDEQFTDYTFNIPLEKRILLIRTE